MGDDTRIHPRDEGTMDQDRLEIRGRVRQVPALEIAAQAPAEAPPADPYWGRRYRSQFNSRAQGNGCDRRRMGPRGGGAQSIGEGFGCSERAVRSGRPRLQPARDYYLHADRAGRFAPNNPRL